MTDKPQHCDHECVCNWWACNVNCDILNDPCRRKNCEHDTRSRPLSEELKKERERLQPLIDAAQEFVDRCDHNEIRSVYTYNKFKGILKSLRGEP